MSNVKQSALDEIYNIALDAKSKIGDQDFIANALDKIISAARYAQPVNNYKKVNQDG
ncbi:hypothetical protein [Niveispirillum lacus]|uniref:hypothetical protein n=1 Tax=Niveispirillum lacus TaxID=1981099 RepID=UPI0013FDF868|nr:hypothetical protein [Niveispirillum lacus]